MKVCPAMSKEGKQLLVALKELEEFLNHYKADMARMYKKGEVTKIGYERFLTEQIEMKKGLDTLRRKVDEIEKKEKGEGGRE